MRDILRGGTLLCLFVSLHPAPTAAADIESGRQKAASCSTCHGKNGMAVMPLVPNLAGQSALYLVQQLQHFRDGRRVSEVMNVVLRDFSDADLEDIAAFYESLPPCAQ